MTQKRPQIVIVGGGFGGLYSAKVLGNKKVDVTLIDRRNFHLFQPLLYQVATGGLSPGDIASPLRAVLNKYNNIRVICDEMTGLDTQKREVILKKSAIKYDALIIATGMKNHYFGNDAWQESAPGLKSVEDALEIRRRIFTAFEEAENEKDPARRKSLMTFVVIGAGPTGVELAGALGELANRTLKNDFRRINPLDTSIYLIEGGERILPAYPAQLSWQAQKKLNHLGVSVRTSTFVKKIDGSHLTLHSNNQNQNLEADTILWSAGVRATEISRLIATECGIETDRQGRIAVNEEMHMAGHPEIFIIGDLARSEGPDGNALPGVSPVAMQQGRYVGRFILAQIKGKKIRGFRYRDKGSLAVIGRNAAVADFNFLQLHGFLAWIIWIFVHIGYLIEFDNKLLVLTQWAWNYFTRKRGARLITK